MTRVEDLPAREYAEAVAEILIDSALIEDFALSLKRGEYSVEDWPQALEGIVTDRIQVDLERRSA